MKVGIFSFNTEYTIRADELAVEAENRGFDLTPEKMCAWDLCSQVCYGAKPSDDDTFKLSHYILLIAMFALTVPCCHVFGWLFDEYLIAPVPPALLERIRTMWPTTKAWAPTEKVWTRPHHQAEEGSDDSDTSRTVKISFDADASSVVGGAPPVPDEAADVNSVSLPESRALEDETVTLLLPLPPDAGGLVPDPSDQADTTLDVNLDGTLAPMATPPPPSLPDAGGLVLDPGNKVDTSLDLEADTSGNVDLDDAVAALPAAPAAAQRAPSPCCRGAGRGPHEPRGRL